MYLVIVFECGEEYEYQYGCIEHAQEHYNTEEGAKLYKYSNGKKKLLNAKVII